MPLATDVFKLVIKLPFFHFSLKEHADRLKESVQDIDTILRSVEFDAEKLAQSTHDAFEKLNSQLDK